MSPRQKRLRYVRFESVTARLKDGSRRKYLLIRFRWQCPSDSAPKRYRESTGLFDTRESRALWYPKIKEIEREIITGSFDLLKWFPKSRSIGATATKETRDIAKRRTIGGWAREYLDELPGSDVGKETIAQYRFIFGAHLFEDPVAAIPLNDLNLSHLKQFRGRLMAKTSPRGGNLKISTVNKIVASVRTMLNVAFERGLITGANPTVRLKNFKRRPSQVKPFTTDEMLDILAACDGQQRALYVLLALGGLRPSEALGLHWEHIDFKEELILVRQQLREDGSVDEDLKTAGSLRDVKMLPPVKAALQTLRAQNQLRSKFVFCNRHGRPLKENWQNSDPWRRNLERAEVPFRVLYNLRHSYTTLMLMAGKPIQWIASQLGHVGIAKIDQVYGRWTNTPDDRRLDLDGFFRSVMGLPRHSVPKEPKQGQNGKAKVQNV